MEIIIDRRSMTNGCSLTVIVSTLPVAVLKDGGKGLRTEEGGIN